MICQPDPEDLIRRKNDLYLKKIIKRYYLNDYGK